MVSLIKDDSRPLSSDEVECYVCSELSRETQQLCNGKTPCSHTPYPQCLGQLLGDKYAVVMQMQDQICKGCSITLDERDVLLHNVKLLDEKILTSLQTKFRNFDHHNETNLCEVSPSASLPQTSVNVKKLQTKKKTLGKKSRIVLISPKQNQPRRNPPSTPPTVVPAASTIVNKSLSGNINKVQGKITSVSPNTRSTTKSRTSVITLITPKSVIKSTSEIPVERKSAARSKKISNESPSKTNQTVENESSSISLISEPSNLSTKKPANTLKSAITEFERPVPPLITSKGVIILPNPEVGQEKRERGEIVKVQILKKGTEISPSSEIQSNIDTIGFDLSQFSSNNEFKHKKSLKRKHEDVETQSSSSPIKNSQSQLSAILSQIELNEVKEKIITNSNNEKLILTRPKNNTFPQNSLRKRKLQKSKLKIKEYCINENCPDNICLLCNEKFDDLKSLHEHLSRQESKQETIICKYCEIPIETLKSYLKHLTYHRNDDNITCMSCGETNFDRNMLSIHMKKAHDYDKTCDMCNDQFRDKRFLEKHVESHLKIQSLTCVNCDKTYTCKEKYHMHLKVHRVTKSKVYNCMHCDNTYRQKIVLDKHIKTHLPSENNTGKECVCNICGKTLNKKSLKSHMSQHTDIFRNRCKICNKGFHSKVPLMEHEELHKDLKDRQHFHTCDICGKQFRQLGSFTTHRKWHDNPYPAECPYCGLKGRYKTAMNVHINEVHRNIKPYKCSLCDQSFFRSVHLLKHKTEHGIFKYKCCDTGFRTKKNYNRHRFKVHGVPIPTQKKKQFDSDYLLVVPAGPALKMPDNSVVENDDDIL